jgi:hypothetical protein
VQDFPDHAANINNAVRILLPDQNDTALFMPGFGIFMGFCCLFNRKRSIDEGFDPAGLDQFFYGQKVFPAARGNGADNAFAACKRGDEHLQELLYLETDPEIPAAAVQRIFAGFEGTPA